MRKPIPSNEVQQYLLVFLQHCFMGEIPPTQTNDLAAPWLRECLTKEPSLTIHEIAMWPNAQRRALYDLLTDCIIALRLKPPFQFPPGELDGSTHQQLSQPLMSALANVKIPTSG